MKAEAVFDATADVATAGVAAAVAIIHSCIRCMHLFKLDAMFRDHGASKMRCWVYATSC